MSENKEGTVSTEEMTELIRTLLIVQLGMAKVPQENIRKIAGCDMNRVNAILKLVMPKSKKKG